MARKTGKIWAARATRPIPPGEAEKRAIIGACEALIRDVLKPRFLPEIRPTEWNYVVDIHCAWAAGRYRFIQIASISTGCGIQGNGGGSTRASRLPRRSTFSKRMVSCIRSDQVGRRSIEAIFIIDAAAADAAMSEYQYYEFQAIDRPLDAADREALRAVSTRARITATSFTNSYDWGNFKGDPAKFMDRWFDLHLYLANWGSRRLMIRLPERRVDRSILDGFLGEVDCVKLRLSGENLILDIARDELELEDWDDGSGWLAALAPLRADVLAGDLRLFYLLWLTAVEADAFEVDELEPMPGIGPMTPALEAFAAFFGLDIDLVHTAAERPAVAIPDAASSGAVQGIIAAMTDREKTGLLVRLFNGDPQVMAELRTLSAITASSLA